MSDFMNSNTHLSASPADPLEQDAGLAPDVDDEVDLRPGPGAVRHPREVAVQHRVLARAQVRGLPQHLDREVAAWPGRYLDPPPRSSSARCRGSSRSSRWGTPTSGPRASAESCTQHRHTLASASVLDLVLVEYSWKVAVHLRGSLIIFSKRLSPPTLRQRSTGSWNTSTPATELMISRKLLLPEPTLPSTRMVRGLAVVLAGGGAGAGSWARAESRERSQDSSMVRARGHCATAEPRTPLSRWRVVTWPMNASCCLQTADHCSDDKS